mmetsp:Transcript_8485/g.18908  ORF Transcript_8485/g.18908 Transcript_8485/m.18908 type:complete len:204 (+) Transcript_8485:1271-1882(+)
MDDDVEPDLNNLGLGKRDGRFDDSGCGGRPGWFGMYSGTNDGASAGGVDPPMDPPWRALDAGAGGFSGGQRSVEGEKGDDISTGALKGVPITALLYSEHRMELSSERQRCITALGVGAAAAGGDERRASVGHPGESALGSQGTRNRRNPTRDAKPELSVCIESPIVWSVALVASLVAWRVASTASRMVPLVGPSCHLGPRRSQ